MDTESLFIGRLSVLAERNDPIDTSLYEKYDVKRGLRNACLLYTSPSPRD